MSVSFVRSRKMRRASSLNEMIFFSFVRTVIEVIGDCYNDSNHRVNVWIIVLAYPVNSCRVEENSLDLHHSDI